MKTCCYATPGKNGLGNYKFVRKKHNWCVRAITIVACRVHGYERAIDLGLIRHTEVRCPSGLSDDGSSPVSIPSRLPRAQQSAPLAFRNAMQLPPRKTSKTTTQLAFFVSDRQLPSRAQIWFLPGLFQRSTVTTSPHN